MAAEHSGMRNVYYYVNQIFGQTVELKSYYGPVQMCVFGFEYTYLPKRYTIRIECERGCLQIEVIDEEEKKFSPWMIFPESRYTHYDDEKSDVKQLIELSYKAIVENKIVFMDEEERRQVLSSIEFVKAGHIPG